MPTLVEKFRDIGARVKVSIPRRMDRDFVVDVRNDKEGEHFAVIKSDEVNVSILDVQPKDRHLIMLVTAKDGHRTIASKFLCGHDERHWFTATIPVGNVTTVFQAKQALKPKALVELEAREGIKGKDAHKRHKKLKSGRKIHRQGEFFFIPRPEFNPGKNPVIHKKEPLGGGGGHVHTVSEIIRFGGRTVYERGSSIIEEAEYKRLDTKERSFYNTRTANAQVFARGKVTHIEHATVNLGNVWHEVQVNNETRSSFGGAMGRISSAFLD